MQGYLDATARVPADLRYPALLNIWIQLHTVHLANDQDQNTRVFSERSIQGTGECAFHGFVLSFPFVSPGIPLRLFVTP